MKYLNIISKDKIDLEKNTILRFAVSEYRKDYKDWINAFEIIGNPVEDTFTPIVIEL